MRYLFDHDLHIHSKLSLCSGDAEQNPERILRYAIDNRLSTICLTDHFWDSSIPLCAPSGFYQAQDFSHVSASLPLPTAEGVRFLFGCETDMDRNFTIGITPDRFEDFDFVIIPTTHFHMTGFTIPENIKSPADKAEFWLEKLDALLSMDIPFKKIGIAHLTCGLIERNRPLFLETIDALSDKSLTEVFSKASKVGVGIELNSDDMNFADSEAAVVLRPYKIAKSAGCKFYLGSDAHHPAGLISAPAIFERAIDLLGLTEDDKFII